jgi:hypothetical protein
MKCEVIHALSEDEFKKHATKKLTKKQLKRLDELADMFEAEDLNVQVCFAHYIVYEFLDLEEIEDNEAERREEFFGGAYG